MSIYAAEEIIKKYTNALATTGGGVVRPLSALKNSNKQLVIDAYKIYMAYMIKHPKISKEQFKNLMDCLLFLNQFVPDKDSRKINKIYNKRKDKKKISTSDEKYYEDFMGSYIKNQVDAFGNVHDEVGNYINTLNPLDHDSPYYCVTAYRLANVEYKPEYEDDFAC